MLPTEVRVKMKSLDHDLVDTSALRRIAAALHRDGSATVNREKRIACAGSNQRRGIPSEHSSGHRVEVAFPYQIVASSKTSDSRAPIRAGGQNPGLLVHSGNDYCFSGIEQTCAYRIECTHRLPNVEVAHHRDIVERDRRTGHR